MALALGALGEAVARGGQLTVPYDLRVRLAACRTAGEAAAFDRGPAEGSNWTLDKAVAAGLAKVGTPGAADPAGSLG